MYAHPGDLFHPTGKFLGANIKNGPSAFCAGEAGIGINNNRKAADLGEPLDDGDHLLRSHAAVDAQSVHVKAFQERDCRIHSSSGQELSLVIKGDRDADRKIAVLLGCQHSGLGLVAVRHGLDQDQVRAGTAPAAHYLCEQFHRLLKGKVPQRLEKFPRRTDVQRHIGVLPACPAPGFLRQFNSCRDDLLEILRELERVCPECICIENIAARAQITAVQVNNVFRPY